MFFFKCAVEINLTTEFFGVRPGRTFCICLLFFVSFSVTFQLSLKSVPLLAPRNRCPIRCVASKSNYTVTVEKRLATQYAKKISVQIENSYVGIIRNFQKSYQLKWLVFICTLIRLVIIPYLCKFLTFPSKQPYYLHFCIHFKY